MSQLSVQPMSMCFCSSFSLVERGLLSEWQMDACTIYQLKGTLLPFYLKIFATYYQLEMLKDGSFNTMDGDVSFANWRLEHNSKNPAQSTSKKLNTSKVVLPQFKTCQTYQPVNLNHGTRTDWTEER